jgi:xanthosine utilization system XapX-like protein
MNHADAVSRGAIERYQLGELNEMEIEEFEAHFFDCAHCADELRAAAIFEENAKAVFLEESRRTAGAALPRTKYEQARPSWWASFWRNPWSAVPALAAVAMLGVVVYQQRIIKQALAPQAMASYVLPALSRGDDRVLEVPKGNTFYALYMDQTWPGSYSEYLVSVQDEKGTTVLSVRIPAPPAGKEIQILMSRNQLPSGRYTVVVRHPAANGQPESELNRYSLILKLD